MMRSVFSQRPRRLRVRGEWSDVPIADATATQAPMKTTETTTRTNDGHQDTTTRQQRQQPQQASNERTERKRGMMRSAFKARPRGLRVRGEW